VGQTNITTGALFITKTRFGRLLECLTYYKMKALGGCFRQKRRNARSDIDWMGCP